MKTIRLTLGGAMIEVSAEDLLAAMSEEDRQAFIQLAMDNKMFNNTVHAKSKRNLLDDIRAAREDAAKHVIAIQVETEHIITSLARMTIILQQLLQNGGGKYDD